MIIYDCVFMRKGLLLYFGIPCPVDDLPDSITFFPFRNSSGVAGFSN